MNAIILAAGYGSRMYPYTINKPKCLLEYKGRKVLDYLLDDLETLNLSTIMIITNNKFFLMLQKHVELRNSKIILINDGTNNNEERLGAAKDIQIALRHQNNNEECIVMGSDNLFDFSFVNLIRFFLGIKKSCLLYYEEKDIDKLKRTGIITLQNGKVSTFIEKPQKVISNLAVPPIYIFSKEVIEYLKVKVFHYDSPGLLMANIINVFDFYGLKMPGKRIDLSDLYF